MSATMSDYLQGMINNLRQKRGNRARLRTRLKANQYRSALLSLFIANFMPLTNKMDDIRMGLAIHYLIACQALVHAPKNLSLSLHLEQRETVV